MNREEMMPGVLSDEARRKLYAELDARREADERRNLVCRRIVDFLDRLPLPPGQEWIFSVRDPPLGPILCPIARSCFTSPFASEAIARAWEEVSGGSIEDPEPPSGPAED